MPFKATALPKKMMKPSTTALAGFQVNLVFYLNIHALVNLNISF
jgi:hypothetical protein